VMFGFGLVGLLLQELEYPIAPFVLGFILGPMAEDNVRRALVITAGDPTPFFTRPISLVLFGLLLFSVVGPTSLGKSIKSRVTALWSHKS
jgi:putative tricarboxylic transport membrane protein